MMILLVMFTVEMGDVYRTNIIVAKYKV